MKLFCKFGIHKYEVQWHKDSRLEIYYESRKCKRCHNRQIKANGGMGDNKWHNLDTFKWGFSDEKEYFNNSIPCKHPYDKI